MKIKKWAEQRSRAVKKSEIIKVSGAEFLRDLQAELGAELSKSFQKQVDGITPVIFKRCIKPDSNAIEFVEKYKASADYRTAALDSMPSGFHRSLLIKSVDEFSVKLGHILSDLTLSDLQKKVKTKDWNRVAGKHDPDAGLMVDHKPHIEKFPVHSDYGKMLTSDMTHPNHKLEENGISAKMVHEVQAHEYPHDQDLYMAKPYHKKIESATKSWVKNPILGWASMATKAMFNAGGIGHLAEDVTTHEHEGIPLTVHKFAHDHVMIAKKHSPFVDPADVHKIAVMDYLSNNLDRHHGNLMVGNYTDPRGTNPLLAIDHERNFQYSKRLWDNKWKREQHKGMSTEPIIRKETPMSYLKGSSLKDALAPNKNAWHSHEDLVDWWKQHGQTIREEMDNQVQSIKDESVRKHVRDNFHDRWHKMNDWASNVSADPNDDAMWQESSLHDRFDQGRILTQEQPRISAKQLKSLPKNKKDALFAISDIVNKKSRLTMNQRQLLHSAIKNIMTEMTPEEAGEVFRSVAENPHMSTKVIRENPDVDVKNQMLRHFSEMNYGPRGKDTYKYDHMRSMADAIDKLPDDKKEILSQWANHYRRLLDERQAA